jgi:hypothetical protein
MPPPSLSPAVTRVVEASGRCNKKEGTGVCAKKLVDVEYT